MYRELVKFIAAWFICFGTEHAVPTLQITDGILTGARGVDVNGVLYDVDFLDGTCTALFSGCDSLQDFPFDTASEVTAASQALLDQVLLDSTLGNFDSIPSRIHGCADNTGQGFCLILTPADFQVNNSAAQNSSLEVGDLVRGVFTLAGEDTTIYDTVVYAVWSPNSPVPELSSTAMLMAGLIMFTVKKRRAATGV